MEFIEYLHIFDPNDKVNKLEEYEKSYIFPYKLDNFQEEGIYHIHHNENVLITAHTGSGKTVLAIYGIAHSIKNNKKVIYTSPTKSLSNQKYNEFIKLFGDSTSIGIMTGDIKVNPDAQIVIMTTEILRNLLYKDNQLDGIANNGFLNMNDVGCVVFDEVHYINDSDRGKVWEESIIMLRKDINLIMLSATIDKAEQFCSWIGNIKQKNIHLIKTSHRVVPLKHYFWKDNHYKDENDKDRIRWEMVQICDNNGNFKNYDKVRYKYKRHQNSFVVDKLIDYLVEDNQIPALFFRFSRKKCEEMCRNVKNKLLDHEELSKVINIFESKMLKYRKNYEMMQQYQDVFKQIQKGVAYHHSGMLPILKEIVEIIFSQGLIKILFATETFAIGVNMPTKTVIFSELEKFDNKGLRLLRNDEYMQMSGRAGRRGLDNFGNVIILPTFDLISENEMRGLMNGKSPSLKSKFKLCYQFVLKTILNKNFDVNNYFKNTLVDVENSQLIKNDISKIKELENEITNIFNEIDEKNLEKLKEYDNIDAKLNHKVFSLKNKDRQKYLKKQEEIKKIDNFNTSLDKFKKHKEKNNELKDLQNSVWYCENGIKYNMDKIIELLSNEGFIENDQITMKGIIASSICEVNELILSEAIYSNLFDDLEFPEIISLISSFINEKDQGNEQRYIIDLKIPEILKDKLKSISEISEYYQYKEDKAEIYINSDFDLYLDFVEPSYIWAQNKSIKEVYQYTNIYDGNFVKSILRISNIMGNFSDICTYMKKYDLLKKIENYDEILIRDVTSLNSLYVDGY